MRARLLGRDGRPAPPARIVHLGLGAFFRAHVAWYTHAVGDDQWGITAFAGRGRGLAATLSEQEGCYTLIERGPAEDRAQIVTSVVSAYPGNDLGALCAAIAAPATALVTLTVTEAGYRRGPRGGVDRTDRGIAADLAALRGRRWETTLTAPGRLVAGLAARWWADGGPLALVPCDNLPANGAVLQGVVFELAQQVAPELAAWVEKEVAFVSTVVDRITPASAPADIEAATRLTGRLDAMPVVTEPFHEWVLCGDFPAGRPPWEAAGARIVDDVGLFERRKLWLLNGAHSLLAYRGLLRGHRTVAEAVADPVCRAALEWWWDEAAAVLAGEGIDAYRKDLLARFANGRIDHSLAQIASDGTEKLAVRVVPVLRATHDAGRAAPAAATLLAAWVVWVRQADSGPVDPRAAALRTAASGDVAAFMDLLGADAGTASEVQAALDRLRR